MAFQPKIRINPSQGFARPPASTKLLNRRFLIILVLTMFSVIFAFSHLSAPAKSSSSLLPRVSLSSPNHVLLMDPSIPSAPIMPTLTNATLKAALGRSAWHLFHTTMSRFPRNPTPEEQNALSTYIYLFARLYPCGDCAKHFTELLEKFPPQVGGRKQAEGWACHVHNQVNIRLNKDTFDCAHVSGRWDCGCGEEEVEEANGEQLGLEKEG